MTVYTFTIHSCKSKCGQMFKEKDATTPSGFKLVMSKQMGEYLKWKKIQAKRVAEQLPSDWVKLNRVAGMTSLIRLHPKRPGRSPDRPNLEGAVVDILTDAGVWIDDSAIVNDNAYQKVSYNASELTVVKLFTTVEEFRQDVYRILDTL